MIISWSAQNNQDSPAAHLSKLDDLRKMPILLRLPGQQEFDL